MSSVGSIVGSVIGGSIGGPTGAAIGGSIGGSLTGESAVESAQDAQERATIRAIQEKRRSAEEGQKFLTPFEQVGSKGLKNLSILTDPQRQFDFLQSNPLFQASLDAAQRGTQQSAAAAGRLSAGDTLQQLSQNVLLSAQPLLAQQQQNVAGLLDFGRGLATTQANVELGVGSGVSPLLQDIGNIQAAGTIGQANIGTQLGQGVAETIPSLFGSGGFGSIFSGQTGATPPILQQSSNVGGFTLL